MKKIAIGIGIIGIAIVVGLLAFSASAPGDTVASELEGTKSPATFIGVDTCKNAGCHQDKYNEWALTGHGKDFTNFDYSGSIINLFLRYSSDPANYTPGRCAACHVVGYNDSAQGGFNISQAYNSTHNIKFLGIQCENCHGPGSEHPGSAPAGIIGNPTIEESCYGDAGSGCHGPAGHDNYYAHSKHNESLGAAGGMVATNEGCQKCHTREGFIDYVEGTTTTIIDPNPIDCSACHDPHEKDYEHQLRMPAEEICAACHNNDYETDPSADPHIHHPQAEMNLGIGGALASQGSGMAGVDCVDCHMWNTPSVSRAPVTDTIGGEAHHDHEFEATAESCADCHSIIATAYLPSGKKPATEPPSSDVTNYTVWQEWELFEDLWENEVDKWQKVIDSWQEDFEVRWAEVNTTISTIYADLVAANATGEVDQTSLDKAWDLYYEALWNLHFVEADGTKGVHNFNYAMALLDEAENNMETVSELITVMAVDPPGEEPTDYTTFFYVVIALLVISMLLSIIAIMRKPQAAMPPEREELPPQEPSKPPEEPPKMPEEPKEV
jgi:predicted CXXCH cytochrome family protein